MSISQALNTALSGLTAVSRAADITSSNVANAMTEGYGVRRVELGAQTLGGAGAGVEVTGVTRDQDSALIRERRIASSERSGHDARARFHDAFSLRLGQVDDVNSLSGKIASLETALREAASRPESETRLQDVVYSAVALTDHINAASDTLSTERLGAETQIATTVESLQTTLQQVVDLNVAIRQHDTSGYDVNALLDQRQTLIDQIADIVPVKEIPRANHMVSLYTLNGAILLDSKAATIEFSAVHTLTPDMTLASGALSGLTVNGQNISLDPQTGALSGGRLGALFELRDDIIPTAQTRLDALARDLMERFEDPSADPTRAVGAAGLFTDNGAAFDPLIETGLAGRLSLNTAVQPAQGGALWRLRDGLGTATEGPPGNAALLTSMAEALSKTRTANSGGFVNIARSAHGLSTELYSIAERDGLFHDTQLAQSSARFDVFKEQELAQGVDTDHELQQLLIIEQSYAANARIIQTIQTLVDQLIGLT